MKIINIIKTILVAIERNIKQEKFIQHSLASFFSSNALFKNLQPKIKKITKTIHLEYISS